MTFNQISEGKLKIGDDALRRMIARRQFSQKEFESGGVILGRHILDTKNIIVDTLTEPIPKDIQSRYSFFRSDKHQELITSVWEASEGTCQYLGEWHTHPEDIPSPSPKDFSSWKKLLKTSILPNRHIFFIIVGTKKIKVWQGDKKTLKIIQIHECSEKS
jgi:integrative and conjugative element protein (TIGR02256 family)